MDEEPSDTKAENVRLKAQLLEQKQQRQKELDEYEARVNEERESVRQHAEALKQKNLQLDAEKKKFVQLTSKLDKEVTKRDQAEADTQKLERVMQDLAIGKEEGALVAARSKTPAEEDEHSARERNSQVSMKLMRVVDQWMRHRDLQQALLRGASITNQVFATLVPALTDCYSLQTLDLSSNLLTMDSCSHMCQLITTAPELSFISLADNLFSLRSVGCFMTAIMERQMSAKKLMPLDLLDLQGNEGLIAAVGAPPPEALLRAVNKSLDRENVKLPAQGPELVTQVMRALWRFLFETGHPQVKVEEISFHTMDAVTLRKMEAALLKVLLLGAAEGQRPVTGNLVLLGQLGAPYEEEPDETSMDGDLSKTDNPSTEISPGGRVRASLYAQTTMNSRASLSRKNAQPIKDPFAALKFVQEPPKPKLQTFNLKQIVNKSGVVLMNMLERLLETTDIDAIDVETEQTLLEFACNTGNIGLAKLCYRKGAKLSGLTKRGDTTFNIVTRNKRYDIMEFLHKYGVEINSCDQDGCTALHIAAENNDIDGICRLIEWGADVNIKDNGLRAPIHCAAAKGNTKATLLLLETGADMNVKDAKLYTAAAHANMNSHFALFDRLSALGGQRHGQINASRTSCKRLGELTVSAGMLKSSSLGRIGKVAVGGMPGPLKATLPEITGKK